MKATIMKLFSNEIETKPDANFITRETFNYATHGFWNYIKMGAPQTPVSFCNGPHYDLIPYTKIAALRSFLDLNVPNKYVTVLRIFFGFRDNRIKLIFLPDIAQELIKNSHNYQFNEAYTADVDKPTQILKDETTVYHWNGSEMLPISFGDVDGQFDCPKNWIKEYQENIIIDKDGVGAIPFNKFKFNGDADDDSRGVTFTFQVLNRFYKNDDSLYVTNVMLPKNGIIGSGNYYHSISFSNSEPLSPMDIDNNSSVNGMHFSDLGTLCPVRCSDIIIIDGFVHTYKFSLDAAILNFNKNKLAEPA